MPCCLDAAADVGIFFASETTLRDTVRVLPDIAKETASACLIERSEPRDLVDVLFLERAGVPPERDLAAALKKDAGVDPAALAWLPMMLTPLSKEELRSYREALAERFRVLATRP